MQHLNAIANKLTPHAISAALNILPAYLGHKNPSIRDEANHLLLEIAKKFDSIHLAIFLEQFPNYLQEASTTIIAVNALKGLSIETSPEQLSFIIKEIFNRMKEDGSYDYEMVKFFIFKAKQFSCQDINLFFEEIKHYSTFSIRVMHALLTAIEAFYPNFEQAHYDIIFKIANSTQALFTFWDMDELKRVFRVLTLIAPYLTTLQCNTFITSLQANNLHKFEDVDDSLKDFIAYLIVLEKMPIELQQKFPCTDYPQLALPLTIASWQRPIQNAITLENEENKNSFRMS